MKLKLKITNFLQYILLIVVAIIMIFPILWIASSSLKSLIDISAYPPQLIPKEIHFENYVEAFTRGNIFVYLKNTLILIIGCTTGTLISSSIVAYPLARMNFAGKKIMFGLILATMMVPAIATIIPQYIMFSKFRWLNSFLPIIVPAFFAFPYNVFLFRQFYRTIPISIDEAALIDGCNRWDIFIKMIVPLSRPTFITIGVLSSVFWWNELFIPLIYIDSDRLKPLTVGALTTFKNLFIQRWDLQMAMCVVMILPPMILYLFTQKYISEGIKSTGMKG
ncbi:MAG: carbohydrate ABC transporter permease [Actinobacteria bacterium]|nr:carbohydrate ABC transporter permease [Actinomycetota bacterium]MBE3113362.1 carbohydrate ABC transporter permease [Actinomycetota bacterium]MBE3126733.1 carbohydrate ABC transporter permease [Candidatus Atribacteria bacterium]